MVCKHVKCQDSHSPNVVMLDGSVNTQTTESTFNQVQALTLNQLSRVAKEANKMRQKNYCQKVVKNFPYILSQT